MLHIETRFCRALNVWFVNCNQLPGCRHQVPFLFRFGFFVLSTSVEDASESKEVAQDLMKSVSGWQYCQRVTRDDVR